MEEKSDSFKATITLVQSTTNMSIKIYGKTVIMTHEIQKVDK